MSDIYENSIFWIEVERIKPNPFQPRREFDPDRLQDLADSIRQYGVLQPLVVTRREVTREDGSLYSEYELIAGERRWRASQLAGLREVPAIIRAGEQSDKLKLEMAIIENLQREDLNPVERAKAFNQLVSEFGLKIVEVGRKIGKSREYVSNTIRLLNLGAEILAALEARQITEGHTRPLLMLSDRPAEQQNLFKEILNRRITVREAENLARRIAFDRARKKATLPDPDTHELEQKLTERLGARVQIERMQVGGKMTIDFFSADDLEKILNLLQAEQAKASEPVQTHVTEETLVGEAGPIADASPAEPIMETPPPAEEPPDDLYNIKNFSI